MEPSGFVPPDVVFGVLLALLGALATLFLGLLTWNAGKFGRTLETQGDTIVGILTLTQRHQEQLNSLFKSIERHEAVIGRVQERCLTRHEG